MEALIPLLVGLVTALISYSSSADTNESNVNLARETNASNQAIQRETNELQMQLAGQANNWSIEQWKRENSYNDPFNQMSRLRSAGINPALAYSNGLMNEAASSPAANMANVEAMRNVVPQIEKPTVPDPLTASQISLNAAQESRIKTQNYKDMALLPYQQASIDSTISANNSLIELNSQKIKESVSRISVNNETASKLHEETENWKLQNQYLTETLEDRVKMTLNQRFISDTDVEFYREKCVTSLNESKALIRMYKASAVEKLSQAHLNDTERAYVQNQVDNYDKFMRNLDAESSNLEAKTDWQRLENELKEKYGEQKAQEEIKKMKQERICGYVSTATNGVRDICVGIGSLSGGTGSLIRAAAKVAK